LIDRSSFNKVGLIRRVHQNSLTDNVARMRIDGIRSHSLLRDDDSDHEVRGRAWTGTLLLCKRDLARYYANQERFLKSLLRNLKALSGPFPLVGNTIDLQKYCTNFYDSIELAHAWKRANYFIVAVCN
jgi:hypothetical protein